MSIVQRQKTLMMHHSDLESSNSLCQTTRKNRDMVHVNRNLLQDNVQKEHTVKSCAFIFTEIEGHSHVGLPELCNHCILLKTSHTG